MIWVVVIGLVILFGWLYFRFFKLYKVKNIVFVDGSLGTGKSFYSVCLAVRLYKKALRGYRIRRFVLGLLSFSPKFKERYMNLEEPCLYSNIRLRNVKFVPLTADLLKRRNVRYSYRSVLLLDEFSLIADQFCYKDRELSERLSQFFKLFRHETKGGHIVINSQSTSDLHYSLKYVLSDYLYIHHKSKFPLITVLKVQEMAYCGDQNGNAIVNAVTGDVEDKLKCVIAFNKYYKYYDCYCYSVFTDDLPVYRVYEFNGKHDGLKARDIVSFKQYDFLKENLRKVGEKEIKDNATIN